ncbi:MAG: MMPL family transporter [Pseudomonadota bacterium]
MAGEAGRTDPAGRALAAWVDLIGGAPRRALAVLVALCLGAVALAGNGLSVDTDSSRMLSDRLPFQIRAKEVNAAFPDIKNAIAVAVRAPDTDTADAAVAHLVERIGARDDVVESVFAPSVDPFFLRHGLFYGSLEEVEGRLTALSSASNLIARLRTDQTLPGFISVLDEARALAAGGGSDPAALDALFAEAAEVFAAHADGGRRAFSWNRALQPDTVEEGPALRTISILPTLDFTRLNPARATIDAVAEEIAALPPALAAGVEVGVTGDPTLRAEELRSVTRNIGLSLGLSLLAVVVLLRIAFRSTGRALLAFAALLATLVLTTGAAALLTPALNLVSVAFVVLMVGLGIDYAIHFVLHVCEATARAPLAEALRGTGRALGAPLALSAATTSLAFLAFTTTDFVGMAQLGAIGGIGVLIAFAVAATVAPAAMAIWPGLAQAPASQPGRGGAGRTLARVAPAFALILGLLGVVGANSVRFDADPMSLRDPLAPSVVTFGWLAERQATSPFRLSVIAEDRADAEATAERLRETDLVARAVWLGDFIPTRQDEKFAIFDIAYPGIERAVSGTPDQIVGDVVDQPAALADRLDGGSAAATALAAALRDYAASAAAPDAIAGDLFQHFPAFQQRIAYMLEADFVSEEALPAPLVRRFQAEDGRLRVEITPSEDLRDPDAVARFVSATEGAEPRVAGGPAQIAAAGSTVAGAIAQATILALAATAILAWLTLRRVAYVLAILAPLVLAGAIVAGASAVLDIPFNYANVIVLPLMIGIGVDSGVHLAMRSVSVAADESVFETSTPRAVIFSALTTVAAFGTLALSDHRGTASMGIMLAIGLGAALLTVLSLTPALIRWARR